MKLRVVYMGWGLGELRGSGLTIAHVVVQLHPSHNLMFWLHLLQLQQLGNFSSRISLFLLTKMIVLIRDTSPS